MTELTWYAIDRQLIGDVVVGDGSVAGVGARSPSVILSKETPIVVGCSARSRADIAPQPPALVVVDDDLAAEVISWIRVYDRPVFPLSQFCRVISAEDLFLIDGNMDPGASRSDVWACVVFGEMLAQGEYADVKLSAIPLSHAASTFSHVVARTALIHGKDRPVDLCVQRLTNLEGDSSLGRKPMSTRDLQLIWGFLQVDLGGLVSEGELLEFIDATLRALSRGGAGAIAWQIHRQSLMSDSVEARVLAFNSVLNDVVRRTSSRDFSVMESGLCVAAAAFLAGRGTSHYFLLRRAGHISAVASVWFGLLAGLRGRQAWDGEWLRAVKGIEKQLRQTMNWTDPPVSDLGWLEYSWLAKNVTATASLSGIARQSARALAIEVLPGAVCQMRTSSSDVKSEAQTTLSSVAENELRAALEQYLLLSERTKKILGRTFNPSTDAGAAEENSAPTQKSFLSPPKSRRSKKS
jgi:hypothetical protein